jgi:pyridoxal phosphate enzyme (YggS family)
MVKENLVKIASTVPEPTRLIAVSKTKPVEMLQEAYDAGQRLFGENKALEMRDKHAVLPKDIQWHFIGHLQTNKVKYIAPYITMIEAVDSFKLLKEIDKQAEKCGRVIDVLLEVHIAEEATKYGFPPEALRQMLSSGEWRELKHVRICGLMMMASNVDNEQQIRSEFTLARSLFLEMKTRFFADEPSFCERSWGMSHDYRIAVEEGSTMVRIGTTIFGPRVY